MAIKNLFGRGVGFGAVHWIVTHGYDSGTTPPVPPSTDRTLVGTFMTLAPRAAMQVRTPVALLSNRTPSALLHASLTDLQTGRVIMFAIPPTRAPHAGTVS